MAIFRKLFSALRKIFRKTPSQRPSRKKVVRKTRRSASRKTVARRRTAVPARRKRPVLKKRPVRKKAGKRPLPAKKTLPAAGPALKEAEIGEITHYFAKISVVVVKASKGSFKVGDQLHIRGASTDFVQGVRSLQIESVDVKVAPKGKLVGLKVDREARVGDKVWKQVR